MTFSGASAAVRFEWARRIEAEYRSSAITQQLVLWLTQIGAPRELLDRGLKMITDELDHADLSAGVCRAAGSVDPPRIEREQLGIPREPKLPLELDVVGAAIRFFALGKTFAVPVLKELRSQCEEPNACSALDRISRDELKHRQFCWDLVGYLVQQDSQMARHVETLLPSLFSDLYRSVAEGRDERRIGSVERAWGLIPQTFYRGILLETARREYIPRLEAVGVDARDAWNEAIRPQNDFACA